MLSFFVETLGKLFLWIISIAIILIIIWLGLIFGPVIRINYTNCMDSKEFNIVDDIRVYEKIFHSDRESFKYYGYKYDAPFLCIENYDKDKSCQEARSYQVKIIDIKQVRLTGRVIKKYSFNAFNSSSYAMEIEMGNKKYFITRHVYDDMRIPHLKQTWENQFKKPTCSLF